MASSVLWTVYTVPMGLREATATFATLRVGSRKNWIPGDLTGRLTVEEAIWLEFLEP